MERFIATFNSQRNIFRGNLKSSMERFIERNDIKLLDSDE